jgi:membrane-associated protein
MDFLQSLAQTLLHLSPETMNALAHQVGHGLYAILFLIIFAETGLVITPFLPGDSLLFGAGALTAIDRSGTLQLPWLLLLLGLAAIAGNTTNYLIGRAVGPRAYNGRHRLFRREHLERATAFFHRHGALAIALSRFVPVVRTFMPFTAGIARMPVARFQLYNVLGGGAWVALFLCGGFLFGNLPLVKNNFGLVTLLIIAVSLLPLLWALWQERAPRGRTRG